MEPDLNFDFDSRSRKENSRWWSWPTRSIGLLMVMIALSSLSLTVMARGTRRQSKPATPVTSRSVPQGPVLTPKAAPGVPAKVMPVPMQRTDRFVIEADAEIDPKMVLKADPTIDPEMVFNPEIDGRLSLPIVPVPVPGNPLVPKRAPTPGEIDPHGRAPRPR
jgi:hypothetical protein